LFPYLWQAFLSYKEVLTHGYLNSFVEGDYIIAELRVQVSGDFLNFIAAKDNQQRSRPEFMELIRSDNLLNKKLPYAKKMLEQKLRGIIFLPWFFLVVVNFSAATAIIISEWQEIIGFVNHVLEKNTLTGRTPALILLWAVVFYVLRRYRYRIIAWLVKSFIRLNRKTTTLTEH